MPITGNAKEGIDKLISMKLVDYIHKCKTVDRPYDWDMDLCVRQHEFFCNQMEAILHLCNPI